MMKVIVIVCLVVFTLCGCGQGNTVKNGTEIQEGTTTGQLEEKVMLKDLLGCDETKVEKIEEKFKEITGKEIDNVENIPNDKKSYLIKVEADGEIYYLKITSKYLLREIREDKEDGKVLYQVVY